VEIQIAGRLPFSEISDHRFFKYHIIINSLYETVLGNLVMNGSLSLVERVRIGISAGESHFREFKSALQGPMEDKKPREEREIADDISRTLVAFANADGGELYIGVEDNGAITGLHHSKRDIQYLLNVPQTHIHKSTPLPSPRAVETEFQGKTVLFFSVPKGTEFIYMTSDGRCLQRKDRDSIPISCEDIHFSRQEKNSREYDRQFVDNATTKDLDIALIQILVNSVAKGLGMSFEKCLQHLELAEYDGSRLKFRKAVLLLFAKDITQWHPRCQVRILKIDGIKLLGGKEYNVVHDEPVTNNILKLIEESWDRIRVQLTQTKFSSDALFKPQILYPEYACREALINAIAHRDYSIEGAGIEVHIYNDRLEFISPGGLISSISIEDINQNRGVHQSRNSNVARVLREIGHMRELGEGVRRIFSLMETNELAPPEFYSDNNSFKVVLSQKYVYSEKQKIWLDNFSELDLTREERAVVLLGIDGHEISPKEIWDAVGITDTDYYRQIIDSLRMKRILKRSKHKTQIYNISRTKRIPKKAVPQLFIVLPSADQMLDSNELFDDSEYTKVFIGNLPLDIDEKKLANEFKKFGEVSNIEIPTDQYSGRQKGFGFIEFSKKESAQKAINASREIIIDGRRIVVDEYIHKPKI
jgi:ATP-dependent DNA helicase RecG